MPVFAEETTSLPVLGFRVGEHATYDRIVFDVPHGATYQVKREGSRIAVQFSIAARIALKKAELPRANEFTAANAGSKEPLTVRFSVSPEAKLNDFISEGSVVIDITGPRVPSAPPVEKKAEKPPESKKEEKPAAETPSAPVPTAPAPALTPAPAAPAQTLSLPTATATPQREVSTVAPAPAPAPRKPVQQTEPLVAPPRSLPPALTAEAAKAILALAHEEKPSPVLTFDPGVPVGAAIFERGGFVTILFDRKLSPPPFMVGAAQRVKAEPIEMAYNIGYRFAVPEGVDVRATREGTVWKIFLTASGGSPGISTDFMPQPDFALGARLLVPTADPPQPIFYTDPVVGDTLIVLPLRETGAFTVLRRLADFEVVPAVQGLVIKPWHERVVAHVVPDGIEITAEGGLKISPPRDTGAFGGLSGKKKESVKTLFNFAQWGGAASDFIQTRQRLMRTVIDVPEDQRLLARLDLARFYFANGMGKEAVALLEMIGKLLPEIETQKEFLALRGAARVLAGDGPGGEADLSQSVLADQPEVTLWRGIGAAQASDWATAYDRFALTISILDAYPEPFRSRFMVLAVESALATGKDKEASDWLSRLEEGGHDPDYDQAVAYLRGVLYSKANRADMAGKYWRQATHGIDRLYKIRAELALVDLGVATKSITPKQAIDRLEGLRFAWRGDSLEFDILRRLGGFYVEDKQFKTGLLIYGQALRLYPSSAEAPELKSLMKELFKNIFLTDDAGKLSPPEAMELYNNYKTLSPEGEDSNKIRLNLAERLVDIDLLEQAGNLIEEVMKSTDDPAEKARTATRLAAVRLLDHRAADALTVLDQSEGVASSLPEEARADRLLLRARALADSGKTDEAIKLLSPQESEKAKTLLADIAMKAKQWDLASRTWLSLIGPPPGDGSALDEQKTSWTVSVALALAQAEDKDGLRRLADAYGGAMDKTNKADLFRLLTHPGNGAQIKDIAAAQARLSEVDSFRNFLDSYRKNEKPKP